MKRFLFSVLLIGLPSLMLMGQRSGKQAGDDQPKLGFGIKAGLNFANVSNAASINASASSGYMAGIFLAPPARGFLGYRTELNFSRQGYDFQKGSTTGSVRLNYLIMPHLTSINLGKAASILLGFQVAYLLNAQADSSANPASGTPYAPILDYYNRFDYGVAGGLEIFLFKSLLIGGRYNLSLAPMYKSLLNIEGEAPSFIPDIHSVNPKNNVVQLFAGFRF
jgi:hypothetical protein